MEKLRNRKITTVPFGTVSFGRFPVHSAGGPSPFGTVGQTGNTTELEENLDFYRTGAGLPLEAHLARASTLDLTGGVGFRLVAVPPVPEPSGQFLALIALFGFVGAFRKSRTNTMDRKVCRQVAQIAAVDKGQVDASVGIRSTWDRCFRFLDVFGVPNGLRIMQSDGNQGFIWGF